MLRRAMTVAGGLFLGLATIVVAFVLGMRARSPRLLGAVRRVNRAIFNPREMKSAGTPGAYASVIRHTGRTSGRPYETPVGAVATDDGFVIALPYGSQTDWLKNVLASGSATIVNEGHTYQVTQPEIMSVEAATGSFSASDRRSFRLLGIDQCLHLRRVEPGAAAPPGQAPRR